jgi:type I restriction enzyme S subunit
MREWLPGKLGDFVNVKHGFAFKGEYITSDETSNILVTPGNFGIGGGFKAHKLKYFNGAYPADYLFAAGDIVVTMTDLSKEGDTLGYSAKIPNLAGKKLLHNQRVGKVLFKNNDLVADYCYWLMRTRDYQQFIVGAASGTSIRHTSPSTIESFEFYRPPLEEQKAIAEVLTSLDAKIDLLQRQNKTLESIAETLFRHWFSDGAQDDWDIKPLDKIADFLNGLACQKYPPENDIDKLPVLKIRELRNGIGTDCDWSTTNVPKQYHVNAGDIIFSWSASLMVKLWDGQIAILNQHLFKVTSDQYPKWFVYFWTKHHMSKFIAIAETKATTMGHIKRSDLSNSMVVVPKPKSLEMMTLQVDPFFEKIIVNNASLRQLETIRDTLLPKLLSGDARVDYVAAS